MHGYAFNSQSLLYEAIEIFEQKHYKLHGYLFKTVYDRLKK